MSTYLASESDFEMAPRGVGIHITKLKTDDFTSQQMKLYYVILIIWQMLQPYSA